MQNKKAAVRGVVSVVLFGVLFLMANQLAFSQYVCQPNGTAIVQTGSIAGTDPTQTSRINRDGVPSSCTGGAPTAAPIAGTFSYDAYNYTNPTGQDACVTVEYDMTGCGGTTNNSTQVDAYSTFDPANANTNVIGKPGFSTVATGTLSFRVAAGASFTIVVHGVATAGTGVCAAYTYKLTYRTGCRQAGYDRSNDGKADPTYYRPSTGTWNVLNSAGGTNSLLFGLSGDIVTPGDYTGDGQTDVSTYRPTANTWFYSTSQSSPQTNVTYVPWGASGDVPVPNDYDKDGKTDVAVFRPSNGTWYVLRSATSTVQYQTWGVSGDIPVTGDYDGDLSGDFAVVRASGGQWQWYILNSNFANGFIYGCGTTTPLCGAAIPWGLTTDRVVSGDFDGDARTDVAVFRPSDGSWQYLRSSVTAANAPGATAAAGFAWGLTGDIPQPADYDGDKRTDFAVFRPSSGTWYISNSNNGTYNTYTAPVWGTSTDQPATSPYLETNP
ncbi:MAG: VCBS repeat-containing protein [Acidobacteria bacterium]|nr:VCBS repeat-containing protein [Acidobacteriota bacterium]